MEKFFEVKGTTFEKVEKTILKVVVIPVLIIVLPMIIFGRGNILAIAIASIYLFVFYFKTQANK